MRSALLRLPVDGVTRRAVLDYVLALHPRQHLPIPVLIREMQAGAFDLGEGLELERAVRDCVGEGLLAIEGGRVRPARRALESEWAG